LSLCYFVADSTFLAIHHIKEVRKHGLHLISKLACNTALYKARSKKRGSETTEGGRYDLYNLDEACLKETREDDDETIKVYQIQALNPSLKGVLLNIVVILNTRKADGKVGIKILICTDLELSYDLVLSGIITYVFKLSLILMMQNIVLDFRVSKTTRKKM